MAEPLGQLLRVRGNVQGVGFRPHVARVARAMGLRGWVRNDADGVAIALLGDAPLAERFRDDVLASLPPLARVDAFVIEAGPVDEVDDSFRILGSHGGAPRTEVAPDAAMCAACHEEVRSPYERRYRYPFTNCTNCGPRYSIVTAIPYDRAHTTMRDFAPCAACLGEYEDEHDRRFHAQPIGCHACGPKAWLERADGRPFTFDRYSSLDMVDAVAGLVSQGEIVAVKGVGGFHLLCDATNESAVRTLRERKRRDGKPFALMARDLDVVRRYACVDEVEATALASVEGPIVLLERLADRESVVAEVAPGLRALGFMLPSNPLHMLIMRRLDRPVVCTSGNVSDEPPAIDEADAWARLGAIAGWFLLHDRPIAQRLDDSIVRSMGGMIRVLRRARGHAPAPLAAPPGFEGAPPILALGGQLKSTVCLLGGGRAVPSQHFGDLDDARAFAAFQHGRSLLSGLFAHEPTHLAIDRHPTYRPTVYGLDLARSRSIEVIAVQHHHAHVAAVMFENGHPMGGPAVLGIALDGLGYGDGGALWGGEFLLVTYASFERVGTLKPVALLGGDRAAHEPWRNLYAHLMAEMGWAELSMNFADLPCFQALADKPRATLDAMLSSSSLSPRASSTGRLFDAVAAALGIRFEAVAFEGQAAMELEALVDAEALAEAGSSELYPIGIPKDPITGLPYLEPLGMWRAILGDLYENTRPALISARFHLSLADAIRRMAILVRKNEPAATTAALSGGVFQNRILFEATVRALEGEGFLVLTHSKLPPNDGCLSVGQAAVAAARVSSRARKE